MSIPGHGANASTAYTYGCIKNDNFGSFVVLNVEFILHVFFPHGTVHLCENNLDLIGLERFAPHVGNVAKFGLADGIFGIDNVDDNRCVALQNALLVARPQFADKRILLLSDPASKCLTVGIGVGEIVAGVDAECAVFGNQDGRQI